MEGKEGGQQYTFRVSINHFRYKAVTGTRRHIIWNRKIPSKLPCLQLTIPRLARLPRWDPWRARRWQTRKTQRNMRSRRSPRGLDFQVGVPVAAPVVQEEFDVFLYSNINTLEIKYIVPTLFKPDWKIMSQWFVNIF